MESQIGRGHDPAAESANAEDAKVTGHQLTASTRYRWAVLAVLPAAWIGLLCLPAIDLGFHYALSMAMLLAMWAAFSNRHGILRVPVALLVFTLLYLLPYLIWPPDSTYPNFLVGLNDFFRRGLWVISLSVFLGSFAVFVAARYFGQLALVRSGDPMVAAFERHRSQFTIKGLLILVTAAALAIGAGRGLLKFDPSETMQLLIPVAVAFFVGAILGIMILPMLVLELGVNPRIRRLLIWLVCLWPPGLVGAAAWGVWDPSAGFDGIIILAILFLCLAASLGIVRLAGYRLATANSISRCPTVAASARQAEAAA